MKIAIVSFVDPFRGLKSGASEVVVEDCLNFCQIGDSVTLYSFFNKSERKNNFSFSFPVKSLEFRTVNNPFLFFSRYPYCVARRFSHFLLKEPWESFDLVLFEGEQVFRIFERIYPRCKKIIIRMHDIESDYRQELAQSQSGPLKLLNRLESLKFKKIEKKISRYYQVPLFFLSRDEKLVFAKRYDFDEKKCFFAPPVYQFRAIRTDPDASGLLYFGDLSLANNAKSLDWFLSQVFPKVISQMPSATLTICGKNSQSFSEKFSNLGKNLVVKGFVSDLESEFASSRAVICPILYGAGVKIKLLEALSFGKVVIVNRKALEGTTFENGLHLLVANDANDFASLCLQCIDPRKQIPDFSSALKKEFASIYSFDYFVKQVNSVFLI
jgi:glycosyltransferase involved in cell wall biosynthesis